MEADATRSTAQEKKAKATAKRSEEDGREFEFCEVCKRNHDQGRRHKFLPAHARALTALLAGFHHKLSDVRFFLSNPSPLRPEHDALNRLWCVFCGCDLREIGSNFTYSNAIKHLASLEHLQSLEDFMRKHRGGMDRVDSFRICEADLLKWEKGCETLNDAAFLACDRPIRPSPGSSKDIQLTLTSSNMDNFEENSVHSFISNVSRSVMPLQSLTNEKYKEHPEVSGFPIGGSIPCTATSQSVGMQGNIGLSGTIVFGSVSRQLSDRQHTCPVSNVKGLNGCPSSSVTDQRICSTGHFSQVLQNLTPISLPSEVCQANIHTGAPPPWLEITEEEKNTSNKDPYVNGLALSVSNSRKSRKLNPKRVGAAWAEKRRVELEMEKRGEIIPKTNDANWLPNFGRVWQTGTRKESRKEFEMEKRTFSVIESQPEFSAKIQPYISKRMNIASSSEGGGNARVKENGGAQHRKSDLTK